MVAAVAVVIMQINRLTDLHEWVMLKKSASEGVRMQTSKQVWIGHCFRLLVVLHQQHGEPALLRSVQRQLPSNLLAHPDVSLVRVSSPVCSRSSASLHGRARHRRPSTAGTTAARTPVTTVIRGRFRESTENCNIDQKIEDQKSWKNGKCTTENSGPDVRGGKCRTGKWRTI